MSVINKSIKSVVAVSEILDTKGYKVNYNWVLKTALYVLGKDFGLSMDELDCDTSAEISAAKDDLKAAILRTFDILNIFGIVEKGLTSKLALLPLVKHVYDNKLYKESLAHEGHCRGAEDEDLAPMRTFLFRAILKNLFDSSTDNTLRIIREAQTGASSSEKFPLKAICQALKDSHIDIDVTDEDIDDWLSVPKKDAFPIMNVIFSADYKGDVLKSTDDLDIDHMFPKSSFDEKSADRSFDLVPNLQLLSASANRSKGEMPFEQWRLSAESGSNIPFLPKYQDDLQEFGKFFAARRTILASVLAEKVECDDSKYVGLNGTATGTPTRIMCEINRILSSKFDCSWSLHKGGSLKISLPGEEFAISSFHQFLKYDKVSRGLSDKLKEEGLLNELEFKTKFTELRRAQGWDTMVTISDPKKCEKDPKLLAEYFCERLLKAIS